MMLAAVLIASSATADDAKSRADAARADAAAAYETKDFLRAAIKLEEAYGHVPDPAYLFEIGRAYQQAEECVKASAAFTRFIELAPAAPNIGEAKKLLDETRACAVFVEGRQLLGAGRPAEACEKFMLAYEADPGAIGTLLNLGLCNEQSGKLATAARWLRTAQKRARSIELVEADEHAAARLAAIASKIPKLDVRVNVANAVIKLDGTELVLHEGIELDPGKHFLEISAPNMKPAVRSFEIGLGGRASIDIALQPIATRAPSHRLAYVVGASGIALWAGTAVLGVIAKREYDAASTRDQQQQWKDIVRYGGTSMFVLGSAAITTSIVLYVRGRRARETVVVPTATAEHVGLGVSGSF